MDWLLKTFPEALDQRYIETAQKIRTFDYEIGIRLWGDFKEKVYEKVVQLNSMWSAYGNILSTENERRDLLTEGKVVAVHQIKSNWVPPVPATPDLMPIIQVETGVPPDGKIADNQEKPIDALQSVSTKYPKVELFIVTYAKDFQYLKLCLKSIALFCKGFSGLTILVPNEDFPEARSLVDKLLPSQFVKVRSGREWKNKGMLWHMAQKCRADEWCDGADFVAHIDSDCVFYKPVTPSTFFRNEKPLLYYEPFTSLAQRNSNIWNWKINIENCLPFSCPDEGMRQHPNCYAMSTYKLTREMVEQKTGIKFDAFVRSCKNEYPQTFCEFPTLSAVALHSQRDLYEPEDRSRQSNPEKSAYPVFQMWSHGPIDKEQSTWFEGKEVRILPKEFVKQLGID